MKIKRLLISFLILAVINLPAQANTQQAVGTGGLVVGSMGVYMAVATGTVIAATGGLAIAAIGAAILISNASSPPSNSSSAPIQIDLNPNVPLKTPEGWTSPTSGSTQPTPPNSQSANRLFADGFSGFIHSTDTAACNSFVAHMNANPPASGMTYTFSSVTQFSDTTSRCFANWTRPSTGESGSTDQYMSSVSSCPNGYTASSYDSNNQPATCALNSPETVAKPETNQDRIQRVGNTFQRDPKQNPADTNPTTAVNVTSNTVTVNGADGSKTVVTINPDGTSNVTTTAPNVNDSNSTKTSTDFSAPNGDGNVSVIGKTSQQTTGQGTANTGTGEGQLDISSLNKEVTQKSIDTTLKDIKTSLDCDSCTLPTDKTPEQKAQIDSEIKKTTDSLDGAVSDYGLYKDLGWSTWVPTFPSGSCTPFTFRVVTQTVSWNFCPKIAMLNELLGWLMSLFGAWTITSMFFKKD